MKHLLPAAGLIALLLVAAVPAAGQGGGSESITVTSNTPALTVSTAIAGSPPTAVQESSSTYSVSTRNSTQGRITARLNTALPAGVTIRVTLTAPSGAASAGAVSLTTTEQNVVTGIAKNATFNNLGYTYTLSATSAAGVVALASRTITFALY